MYALPCVFNTNVDSTLYNSRHAIFGTYMQACASTRSNIANNIQQQHNRWKSVVDFVAPRFFVSMQLSDELEPRNNSSLAKYPSQVE